MGFKPGSPTHPFPPSSGDLYLRAEPFDEVSIGKRAKSHGGGGEGTGENT